MTSRELIYSKLPSNEYKIFIRLTARDKHLYSLKFLNNLRHGIIVFPSEWYHEKYNKELSFREISRVLRLPVQSVIETYHTAMFKIKLYLESKEVYSLHDIYSDTDNI